MFLLNTPMFTLCSTSRANWSRFLCYECSAMFNILTGISLGYLFSSSCYLSETEGHHVYYILLNVSLHSKHVLMNRLCVFYCRDAILPCILLYTRKNAGVTLVLCKEVTALHSSFACVKPCTVPILPVLTWCGMPGILASRRIKFSKEVSRPFCYFVAVTMTAEKGCDNCNRARLFEPMSMVEVHSLNW